VDIRTVGSKNIGATNLGRTLGKKYFWMAFLLDAAKGFLPVLGVALLARRGYGSYWLFPSPGGNIMPVANGSFPSWAPLLTAIACVLGHNFPVWLKFKGGKGVATSLGVTLGFWPLYTFSAVCAGLVFVFVLMIYRYISLASIVGVLSFVVFVYGFGQFSNLPTYTRPGDLYPLLGVAGLFALLIIWRHKANIGRLLKGTEPQVGQRERDKAEMK
jgi:glycerol-3-phosphate acyltransferase PlsY